MRSELIFGLDSSKQSNSFNRTRRTGSTGLSGFSEMEEEGLLHSALTERIINCYYNVYNKLRYGFMEKIYENAMLIELKKERLKAESQKRIDVFYEGSVVGEYFADIIVEDLVILELKAAERICPEHSYQLLNYLKATDIEVGLLLNFGRKPEFVRKTFLNIHK